MKNTGRAKRRAQRDRFLAKAKKIFKGWWGDCSEQEFHAYAAKMAKNRQECSCPSCGHYREHEGQTIQEKRQPSLNDRGDG